MVEREWEGGDGGEGAVEEKGNTCACPVRVRRIPGLLVQLAFLARWRKASFGLALLTPNWLLLGWGTLIENSPNTRAPSGRRRSQTIVPTESRLSAGQPAVSQLAQSCAHS